MVACAGQPDSRFGARSIIGSFHYDTSIPNQDAYLSLTDPHIYAVLDGHGPEGHALASRAAHALVSNIREHLRNSSFSTHNALLAAFAATAELVDSNPAAAVSGTTASVAIIQDDLVTVANIGDSDVVWAKGRSAEVVTVRHRANREPEKKRVQNCGAIVEGGYLTDPTAEGEEKMIALTRAFGNLDVRNVGVICTPEINEFEWQADDFLILATDGLWDAHGGVTPQDAVRVVRRCFDMGETANDAVNELIYAAKGRETRPFDDATVIIVRSPQQSKVQERTTTN